MARDPGKEWFREILSPLRPHLREMVLFSGFINLLALAVPVFVLQVYDRVVFFAGLTTLQALVIGVAIAVLFDFVLRQSRSRLLQRIALRIDALLGRKLFEKLSALPLQTTERQTAADWQVYQRDVEAVRNVRGGPTAALAVDVPFALIFLIIIAVIAAPLLWALGVIIPIFLLLAGLSSFNVSAAHRKEQDATLDRDSLTAELIAGRTTLKALNLVDAVRGRWEDRHTDTIERGIQRGRQVDTFGNLGISLALLTTVSLTTVGAVAILEQQLTVGALIAANMLANRITQPLNQLVGQWRLWARYREARERLDKLFALGEDRIIETVELPRPRGLVSFEDVTFRYNPDAQPAVDSVTFSAEPGGLFGIVGRSGCGKTTLLKIIQGLYPSESRHVSIDDADIEQFSRPTLARWFGYVPQETFLLSGTIRDNIARHGADVSDEEIVRAAKLAGAHEFIVEMPDGYAANVGEAGRNLSGGQRQRITIARALLGDPPVILLDEPTSNLDRPSEEELRNKLIELSDDHTIIVVTHSPILLAACKKIMVLERGRVAAAGAGKEILARLFAGQGQRPPLRRTQ